MKDMINLLSQLTSLQKRFMPSCDTCVDVNFNLIPSQKALDVPSDLRVVVHIAHTQVNVTIGRLNSNFSAFSSNSYLVHRVAQELERQKAEQMKRINSGE